MSAPDPVNPEAAAATARTPLEEARAAIDAVDDQVLALIVERARLADVVAVAKAGDAATASPMRPARETALLRRLIAAAPKDMDKAVIVEVWRALISANLRRQHPVDVFVGGSPDPVRHHDVARRHFGAATRIARAEDARATLTRMIETPSAAAVLPFPGNSGPGMWWPILSERKFHGAAIVAALPLRGTPSGYEGALVAAGVPLEASGDDTTLALAFDEHHKLARALNQVEIKGREIARANTMVLVEFEGFVAEDDRRLVALEKAGLDGVRVVGVYARI
jgi:chorismate mutase